MIRLWLLVQGRSGCNSRILSGVDLAKNNIHPLRCVYLGLCESPDDPATIQKAQEIADPATIIARNVRIACDRRQTARWRLSEQELDLLISGESLQIVDGLGRFAARYSKL